MPACEDMLSIQNRIGQQCYGRLSVFHKRIGKEGYTEVHRAYNDSRRIVSKESRRYPINY